MRPNGAQYTPGELAALDHSQRVELRDLLTWQMSDAGRPMPARRWAADALAVLAKVGLTASDRQAPATPPRVPRAVERSVDERVADAKAALYGDVERGGYQDPAGRSVQQRVDDARAFLRPAPAGEVRR